MPQDLFGCPSRQHAGLIGTASHQRHGLKRSICVNVGVHRSGWTRLYWRYRSGASELAMSVGVVSRPAHA